MRNYKYLLRTKEDPKTFEYEIHEVYSETNVDEKQMLVLCQKFYPDYDFVECKQLNDKTHICKYCGWVADGTDDDLLCKDCRGLFGHSLYSEL